MARTFDVVVAGATPAGISAAIMAARGGLRVALVDPLPAPGGMLSNGLCVFDAGSRAGVVGIMSEFVDRVAAYHREQYADQPCVRENRCAPRNGVADGMTFEPGVASRILAVMIAETADLRYFPRHELLGAVVEGDRAAGVRARRIEGPGYDPRWAFRDESPALQELETTFSGRVVIDATYEGDVAASAGVPFRVGREARSRGEPHAGVIMTDYFTTPNATRAGWLPETFLPGSTGAADHKVMGYNCRFVVKHYGVEEGPHRLARPEGYDPAGHPRHFRLWADGWIPNRKAFINNEVDVHGELLSSYPTGSPAQRRAVLDELYRRARHYLYFLQTEMGNADWGLADDEFPENGGWPYTVYVREARRIVGMATLGESDVHRWLPRPGDSIFDGIPGERSRPPLQRDSVAVGDFEIDCHPCDDKPARDYQFCGEGGFMLSTVRAPYQIPFGCMVPQQVKGLLVTCAISVSHVAQCVSRMEAALSQLGQAAGAATVLALASGTEFQELDVRALQARLIAKGNQLHYYSDLSAAHPAFAAVQELSLRGAARGFPDWSYRPDRPITRGEWAQMLVAALDLWPSVSAHHFDDVPPAHPAFVALETLYDHGSRSGVKIVTYESRMKVWCSGTTGTIYTARPDEDVRVGEAMRMLELLDQAAERPIHLEPGALLSRGDAARLLVVCQEQAADAAAERSIPVYSAASASM